MNFRNLSILSMSIAFFMVGCSDSASDEFEEVNGDVKVKLLKSISTFSPKDEYYNRNFTIGYDADGRVSTVSNGEESSIFVYENGSLSDITGGGSDAFDVNELYKSPYDAFEVATVEEYDENKNPKIVSFIEEEYNYNTQDYTYECKFL